jgi:GxxExxY protein
MGQMDHLNGLTERIIGCAIEVHRHLGPGLFESIYEGALAIELDIAGLKCTCQVSQPAVYKGRLLGRYRIDSIVEDSVVVEVKSVERFDPVHAAQVLTYLRLTGLRVGLLLNFNSKLLTDGLRRYIL